ncbi:hypothetical protein BH11ARM2_BH11ARM2_13960 [soil metagenome]
MNIPPALQTVIVSDPEILGGTPAFKGTRVPLETFLDHIEYGYSVERFLEGYSSVQPDQAAAVLHWQGQESRRALGLELF